MTKVIGYARTSTRGQDLGLEVQLEALEKQGVDKIYSEKISGRKENRKEFSKALAVLENGDTLVIYNLSRMGRSTKQLVNLMADLNEKGIYLRSIQDSLDTSTPSGRFVYTILSGVAQLEAELISQRTKEALAHTKKRIGNPGIDKNKVKLILEDYMDNTLTLDRIAERNDVSVKTVYNIAKKHELTRKKLVKEYNEC
jgi:DNA invertase Pin-like site-specific DNA recombinase